MKFRLTFLLLCLSLFTMAQSQSIDDIFDGRSEIYFRFAQSQMTSEISFQGGISIDKFEDGYVYAYASKPQFADFLTYGFTYEKLTAPSLLLPESELNMRNNIDLNSRSTLAWDYYPTYTAYISLMQQFATNYPAICKLDTIGTTVDGRLLLVVKISDNVNSEEYEPEFFYTSSMHGDETTGYVLMLHLIDYLLTNYGTITRVTNLVNNMEIYINPLANPDGTYAGGNTSVSGATRYNANGTDLNRNYPVPDGSAGDDGTYTQQIETQEFVAFIENRNFVASANFHGGIELANYPWDYTSTDHADKTWWMYVCKEYADTAQANSPAGYFEAQPSMYVGSPDYPGVVEGYSWYPAPGSRQDYSQYFAQCREVTLEVSDTKTPSASTLESYWTYNYKSMLNYMEQAQYGIKGLITDNCTGLPIEAFVTITAHDVDSSQVRSAPELGNYHRPIAPGTWNMSVSAPGYQTATATGVTTVNKTTVVRNFSLTPIAPVADFAADVTSTCSGVVQFSNTGTYPAGCTFLWNFGDGQTSTLENPQHSYTTNGTYNVQLTITACAGADSETKTSYISVNMPTAPTASGNSRCGTGSVSLTASGSGTLNWYTAATGGTLAGSGSPWSTPSLSTTTTYYVASESTTLGAAQHAGMTDNSGGGQYFSSTSAYRYMIFDVYQPIRLESVKVYVNTAGIRTIYLQNSSGVTLDSVVVTVPTGQNPYLVTLDFDIPVGTAYRLGVKTGSTNNLYIASGPSYPYTVPGVISITGNNQNQSYFYFFFDWIVKTMETCSSARVAATATINPQVAASFTNVVNGNSVDFTSTSSNAIAWSWDFGDGQTSTQENPTHVYASTGNYTVTLIATGSGSCPTDTFTQSVTITNAPNADFSATQFCAGYQTVFYDESTVATGSIVSWNWDFGDGTGTSSQQNPTYVYADSGWYSVTLIIESNIGAFDTIVQQVHILSGPTAAFSTIPAVTGQTTSFNDLSTGNGSSIISWSWSFGDGGTSVLQNPDHVYSSEGTYWVTLVVTNSCGSDTVLQQVVIITDAIEETAGNLVLFPNPVQDGFTTLQFTSPANEIFTIRIFSAEGKLIVSSVFDAKAGDNQCKIDLSELSEGMYWLELSSATAVQRIQLMK
ncbi:hypothetical protein SDC9_59600 [bioreactor metagenome]|uniref:PKD domain-containing protein n=1 Tax=bioreactor metagenome TaxID=1076179 RepID=A0A644XGK3_9ZZZZ